MNNRTSSEFSRRLTAYVAGAGAAVVGSAGADAAVIYTDIPDTTLYSATSTSATYALDLNADTVTDFTAAHRTDAPNTIFSRFTLTYGTNQAVTASAGDNAILVLNTGTLISGASSFSDDYKWFNWPTNPNGNWNGDSLKFAGLRFDISGQTHYGWVRVSIASGGSATPYAITLHDFAYQSTPNVGILIPEPASLGLMALGATGLMMRRKKH